MANFDKDMLKRIETVLGSLDHYAHCGAVYHDIAGGIPPLSGRAFCRLCAACVKHGRAGNFCRQAAISGAYRASAMGDTYSFRCWLGLSALVIPVSPKGSDIKGAIEVGGILRRGELQKRQHQIISVLRSVGAEEHLESFLNAFQGIDEMPELNVEHLSSFLKESLFSSGLLDSKGFDESHASWLQQQRIEDSMKTIGPGERGGARKRILMAMDELVAMIREERREAEIIRRTDELLALIKIESSDDLGHAKALALPALSLMASDSIVSGGKWSGAVALNSMRIEELEKISTMKDLCFWIETLFTARAKKAVAKDGPEETLSSKVIKHLHQNYGRKIVLRDLAKAVGESSSSVMHKLKAETGQTYTQMLNSIRVKEAKRLLAFTALPLGEISIRCGFKDQSYFSKIFTKYVNIGPREFRRMLNVSFKRS